MRLRGIVIVLAGLLSAGGCLPSPSERLPSHQPGSFSLTEVASKEASGGTLKTWRAVSRSTGEESFAFRLEMLLKPLQGEIPMAFSQGAIIREPDADGRDFLKEIARAIEAEADIPSHPERVDRLEFSTAILGTSLRRNVGDDLVAGRFTSTKPGDWIVFKLFLGEEEAEVYLNINPVSGEGEFAPKDTDYGPAVLRELAKVFYP
ncbi:MAG TPA: hypothetical protein VLU25_02855 [Acidobacteriota bacterium]|nr:hypothetical protein [Acidobacteriota bacterium]